MKKIFTIFSIVLLAAVLLGSCTKRTYVDEQDYWLSKEYGLVVYSDGRCPYYVVETRNGYTIILSTGGFLPYEGDEVYGDLSRRGYRQFYNYTDNSIMQGEVTDYWLSYADAQYAIDNLCYTYSKSGTKKAIRQDLKMTK